MHRQRTACVSPQQLTIGLSAVYLTGVEMAANVLGRPRGDDDDPVAACDGIRNNGTVGAVWLFGGKESAALIATFH